MSERASRSVTERASVCVCEREGREDATNAARQQFNTSLNLPVRATERRERERRERSFHFSPSSGF